MGKIADDVKTDLGKEAGNEKFIQGLLQLLEDTVMVRCRKKDEALLQKCVKGASDQYSKVIKEQTGAQKTCTISIDKSSYLDEKCLGGVVLSCQNNTIVIDNTIDLRLKLVLENDRPAIRSMLFPQK